MLGLTSKAVLEQGLWQDPATHLPALRSGSPPFIPSSWFLQKCFHYRRRHGLLQTQTPRCVTQLSDSWKVLTQNTNGVLEYLTQLCWDETLFLANAKVTSHTFYSSSLISFMNESFDTYLTLFVTSWFHNVPIKGNGCPTLVLQVSSIKLQPGRHGRPRSHEDATEGSRGHTPIGTA